MRDKEEEIGPLVGDPVAKVLGGDVQLLGTVGEIHQVKIKEA